MATFLTYLQVHRRNKKSYSTSGSLSSVNEDDDSATVLLIPSEDTETKDCSNTINNDEGEYELWISAYINYFNYKYYITGCCLGTAAFL